MLLFVCTPVGVGPASAREVTEAVFYEASPRVTMERMTRAGERPLESGLLAADSPGREPTAVPTGEGSERLVASILSGELLPAVKTPDLMLAGTAGDQLALVRTEELSGGLPEGGEEPTGNPEDDAKPEEVGELAERAPEEGAPDEDAGNDAPPGVGGSLPGGNLPPNDGSSATPVPSDAGGEEAVEWEFVRSEATLPEEVAPLGSTELARIGAPSEGPALQGDKPSEPEGVEQPEGPQTAGIYDALQGLPSTEEGTPQTFSTATEVPVESQSKGTDTYDATVEGPTELVSEDGYAEAPTNAGAPAEPANAATARETYSEDDGAIDGPSEVAPPAQEQLYLEVEVGSSPEVGMTVEDRLGTDEDAEPSVDEQAGEEVPPRTFTAGKEVPDRDALSPVPIEVEPDSSTPVEEALPQDGTHIGRGVHSKADPQDGDRGELGPRLPRSEQVTLGEVQPLQGEGQPGDEGPDGLPDGAISPLEDAPPQGDSHERERSVEAAPPQAVTQRADELPGARPPDEGVSSTEERPDSSREVVAAAPKVQVPEQTSHDSLPMKQHKGRTSSETLKGDAGALSASASKDYRSKLNPVENAGRNVGGTGRGRWKVAENLGTDAVHGSKALGEDIAETTRRAITLQSEVRSSGPTMATLNDSGSSATARWMGDHLQRQVAQRQARARQVAVVQAKPVPGMPRDDPDHRGDRTSTSKEEKTIAKKFRPGRPLPKGKR